MTRLLIPLLIALLVGSPHQVAPWAESVDWSPDGKQIVYAGRVREIVENGWNDHLWVHLLEVQDGGLRYFPAELGNGTRPIWSPNGAHIALIGAGEFNNPDIFVMDADGRNLRNMTRHIMFERDPAWSPDGKRLIFWREKPMTGLWILYIIGLDEVLPTALAESFAPYAVWSPDGTRILYQTRQPNTYSSFTDFVILSLDGSEPVKFINDAAFYAVPVWSPDGRTIIYVRRAVDSDNSEIYSLDLSTGDRLRLTEFPGEDHMPAWSPDRQHIAFVRTVVDDADADGDGTPYWQSGLYLMDADGGNVQWLTPNLRTVEAFAWSPDGSRLALVGKRTLAQQYPDLYLVAAPSPD